MYSLLAFTLAAIFLKEVGSPPLLKEGVLCLHVRPDCEQQARYEAQE